MTPKPNILDSDITVPHLKGLPMLGMLLSFRIQSIVCCRHFHQEHQNWKRRQFHPAGRNTDSSSLRHGVLTLHYLQLTSSLGPQHPISVWLPSSKVMELWDLGDKSFPPTLQKVSWWKKCSRLGAPDSTGPSYCTTCHWGILLPTDISFWDTTYPTPRL